MSYRFARMWTTSFSIKSDEVHDKIHFSLQSYQFEACFVVHEIISLKFNKVANQ